MLVPLSWLREFTPYEGTAQALGDRLTMLGLELEDIINPFAELADIKVGFVAECTAHPDSDHMHCCKVDLGQGDLVDIVCGAPNVAAGQKVAVAPVGAKLPGGLVIKKAKLRGQPSHGMICSERELGLSEDHSGIMILPDAMNVGEDLISALNLDTEVLDISITPNRADCLSILGVARETAMAYGLPFHVDDLPLIPDKEAPEITVPVQIANPELCWLYTGRVITNATVAPSPMKIRYRLHAVGVRAISNIVDITNYILFECGQPLHSFDLDKLAGGKIIVRTAKTGESLVTLDGRERILTETDLCICDEQKPVGLAGVMGGENTEISATSKNVFLESAVFQPASIRKTARRFSLGSEAAYRFERGIDQQRTIWALDRACAMMASVSGGYVRRGFACVEPKPFRACHINFRPARANALLGVDVPTDSQFKTLQALGCAVTNDSGADWEVVQPSWRPDLTREADLIEEVGRVYGLDTIAPALPPVQRKLEDNLAKPTLRSFQTLIRRWGSGLGLNEVINYSFVGQKDLDQLNESKDKRITICNPLSEEQNVLRTILAPGLLRDLANNLSFGVQSIKIFELATAFERNAHEDTGAREIPKLAILLNGALDERPWPPTHEELGYADIKGCVENLGAYLHLPKFEFIVDNHPWLLPAVNVSCNGVLLGCLGRVKPQIAQIFNAQKAVWMAELLLEELMRLHQNAIVTFRSLPVYPGVKRDITVTAGPEIKVAQILEKILLAKLPNLEEATLVDCFKQPGSTERNLTFRLAFRHPERTLKDAEVDKEREKLADILRKELAVKI